jgi:hypothetical protein
MHFVLADMSVCFLKVMYYAEPFMPSHLNWFVFSPSHGIPPSIRNILSYSAFSTFLLLVATLTSEMLVKLQESYHGENLVSHKKYFCLVKPTWCSFFSMLRIKGFYMFRALFVHLQEVLHKRQLVNCVCVMSVMSGLVKPTDITRKQYTKWCLCSTSWGQTRNARNV